MEWFLVKIVLGQFIMWSILFRTSTTASTKSLDDFDFSSEEVPNTQRKTHQSQPKPKAKENSHEFITNILHEVGHTSPQRIYRQVYNEPTTTKVCFKALTYVKQNHLAKGHTTSWREQEVILDFDWKEHLERKIDENKHEKLMFKVKDPDTDTMDFRNFTVVEKNRDFTLSKHEKLSCATGKFLVKSYYEWPGSNSRKVVLRLSNDNNGAIFEKDEMIGRGLKEQKPKVSRDESVGSRPPKERTYDSDNLDITSYEPNQIEENSDENSPSYSFIISDDNDNINQNINMININTMKKPKNSVSADKTDQEDSTESDENRSEVDDSNEVVGNPHISFDVDEENDVNEIFYPEYEDNMKRHVKPRFNRTQLEDLCSPILSQLLTGKKSRNGIIPGLCNLKKDEKVMIKGDVIVSKSYYNKANKTTLEKKLYMIHENTVILPIGDQPEKHPKKHKKKHPVDIDSDDF